MIRDTAGFFHFTNRFFDIVKFPFLDSDLTRRNSYGVNISQLIRFARMCNHVKAPGSLLLSVLRRDFGVILTLCYLE